MKSLISKCMTELKFMPRKNKGLKLVHKKIVLAFLCLCFNFIFHFVFVCLALDTSFSSLFQKTPTLLWLTPSLGLDTPTGMEFLCIVGIVVSLVLLVSQRCRDCLGFLMLWFLYYSMLPVSSVKCFT